MWKRTLIALFFSAYSFGLTAQIEEEIPPITQGKKLGIDLYHGTPMFLQWTISQAVTNGLSSNYYNREVSLSGPFGLRLEYLVNSDFGLSLDLGYNGIKASATRNDIIYNPNTGTNDEIPRRYEFSSYKIGAIVNVNVRLYQQGRFEASGVLGVGFGQRKTTVSGSQSQGGFINDDWVSYPSFLIFPVSFRVGFITRFFFTPNIGLNFGLGVGQGGLLNGGLSARF